MSPNKQVLFLKFLMTHKNVVVRREENQIFKLLCFTETDEAYTVINKTVSFYLIVQGGNAGVTFKVLSRQSTAFIS